MFRKAAYHSTVYVGTVARHDRGRGPVPSPGLSARPLSNNTGRNRRWAATDHHLHPSRACFKNQKVLLNPPRFFFFLPRGAQFPFETVNVARSEIDLKVARGSGGPSHFQLVHGDHSMTLWKSSAKFLPSTANSVQVSNFRL
jgi:hypothetical protein